LGLGFRPSDLPLQRAMHIIHTHIHTDHTHLYLYTQCTCTMAATGAKQRDRETIDREAVSKEGIDLEAHRGTLRHIKAH
jgi:hypothetical protein